VGYGTADISRKCKKHMHTTAIVIAALTGATLIAVGIRDIDLPVETGAKIAELLGRSINTQISCP
jgi:hypothetical protein